MNTSRQSTTLAEATFPSASLCHGQRLLHFTLQRIIPVTHQLVRLSRRPQPTDIMRFTSADQIPVPVD
jgi:hypothetical protein